MFVGSLSFFRSIQDFCPFLIGLFAFLFIIYMLKFFKKYDYESFARCMYYKHFSQCVACLLVFLLVSLDGQTFLFWWIQFITFTRMVNTFLPCLRNICLFQHCENILSNFHSEILFWFYIYVYYLTQIIFCIYREKGLRFIFKIKYPVF